MVLKIDTKFKGKLACGFKNDMKNFGRHVHRLKNSGFILDCIMTELNQNQNPHITTGLTRCSVKT